MAGRGSRFASAGFKDPKPLIPVGGKPMIQWVIENVRPNRRHRFIFICLAEHLRQYPTVAVTLANLCPGCEIVVVDGVTKGAACTVLLAREYINNSDPLMIVNSDQFVEINIDAYLDEMDRSQADGQIMTFWSDHPKWSYCKMKDDSTVAEVVEKKVVSNEATVGIYNYRLGSDFVRAADMMIKMGLMVNNEFYVAPAYNQLIANGHKIITVGTGREYNGMFGLGVPDDLAFFRSTKQYAVGWIGGEDRIPSGAGKLQLLTELYARFFNQRNIAALSALLAEDCILCDIGNDLIQGGNNILNFVNTIHDKNPDLDFNPKTIIASDSHSVIEFALRLSGHVLNGLDLIEWRDGKIVQIRVYTR